MAQSRMFDHCVRVYECMEQHAFVNDFGDRIYRGFLSNLFQEELGLPLPYYTPLKRILEDQGCIVQQKRGGGKTPSEWKLIFPPDPNAFSQRVVNPAQRRTRTPSHANDYTIARLSERLSEVEDKLEILMRELANGNNGLGNSE